MTELRFLSAALIAATVFVTPAVARESHIGSRHHSSTADAHFERGVRLIDEGNRFRRYESRDVWGHWGTYYGPMVPAFP